MCQCCFGFDYERNLALLLAIMLVTLLNALYTKLQLYASELSSTNTLLYKNKNTLIVDA